MIFFLKFTFTLEFQFYIDASFVNCLQLLGKAKGSTAADDHDSQPRRSMRIQEIEAKREIELQKLQNEQKLVAKQSVTSSSNMKCAHRSRSKSVASERPPHRRPLAAVNRSKTPPNVSVAGGRRCNSRAQSTACDRNTEVPPNVSARCSLFDSSNAPSRPKRWFMAKSIRRCNHNPNPVGMDMPLSSDGALNTPVKSNIKSAHRCLNRSKSVTFEVDRSSNASPKQSLVTSNDPIDLSVQTPAPHQPIAVPNAVATHVPNVPSPKSSGQLASDIQLSYENRIDNLVRSNFAKINRIKEVIAENHSWREQYDTLNRINQSLVATIDAFNAQSDPSVREAAAQKAKYENEIEGLRDRINRLNRENFDLRSTNERLMSSLATHSKQISGEHNYNL